MSGTTKINGVAAANPTISGQQLQFTLPSAISPGVTATVEFDATVAGATPSGVYTVNISSWVMTATEVEDNVSGVAPVYVGKARSDTPTVIAQSCRARPRSRAPPPRLPAPPSACS